MIWIVRTRCVMGGTGQEWIHFVRCVSKARAVMEVVTALGIPQDALNIEAELYERFVKMAEIESRTWHYTE